VQHKVSKQYKKGPRTNAQKARDVNVKNFGNKQELEATTGDYANWNKVLPKSHTDFKKVIACVNADIEKATPGLVKSGVSTFHVSVFNNAYKIAMRNPVVNVWQVKCPKCKRMHAIVCDNPECGNTHEIEMPSAQLEKNSVTMLAKLMDKFAPNLAAITQDVNVNITLKKITQQTIYIISKYIPANQKDLALAEFNLAIGEAIDYVEATEE